MICRSQRQRSGEGPATSWDVHLRLARGRDRNRHTLYASVLALVAALLGWLLGLDLPARAALLVAAAGIAWLVPLRGSNEWALEWIGDRAGLAYQTALEMEGGDDPYGLRRVVEERASSSLTRVERPEHPAWWLPLLALALGALLLPALPIVGGGGLAGGPFQPGMAGDAPAGPGDEEEPEEEAPDLPGEERTRVARSPEGGEPQDEPGGEGEAGGEGRSGEREALERYLQSIRQRPAETEDEEQQDSPQEGEGQAPGGAAPRPGAQERQGDSREGAGGQEQPQQGEGNRSGEQAGEGRNDSGSGDEGEEQQDGQNPFAQAGEDEEPGEAGQQGRTPPASDGRPGDEQLEEGGEETTAPGDSPAGGEQQGQGEGAGALPSVEQEAGRAGGQGEETLQLRGELGEGPLSSGGTIQLPGGDEVELPPGRTPEAYDREVERAVTEGRVPLEYQEIIRNYFR